jgi:cation diffusion facilitator family transporter
MTPRQALGLSVGAAAATIALKWAAWWWTGSVAFLSDALDSVVNFAAAAFALAMVTLARRSPDEDFPSGYGKAEYFSAAVEGLLILAAALGIAFVVAERISDPRPIESVEAGSALSIVSALLNLAVAQLLIRTGRASRSLATEADGRHLMADVWMTGGVIAGVAFASFTGWLWLDPAVAILIALNLAREAWKLLTNAYRGLMDAAWPAEDIERLKSVLRPLQSDGVSFENLRTRRAGAQRFALVELRVPSQCSVERAHRIVKAAEKAAAARCGVTLLVRLTPASA